MRNDVDWWMVTTGLSSLLWPVLQGFLVYAAVLFFRADRRFHAGCFLAGSCLGLLLALWRLVLFSPRLGGGDMASAQIGMAIQTGLSLIAQGLSAYGLVAIALIQFRQASPPPP